MKFKLIYIFIGVLLLTSCGSSNEENIASNSDSIIEEEQVTEIPDNENDLVSENNDYINLSNTKSIDIYNNPIDENLFKGKYTLVNVWGTFCGPCIVEMPELQKINENYKSDNFQVVGIISDTYIESEEYRDDAIEIINQTGVDYINIVPDANIMESILREIQFLPTSFILDENGQLVGELVFGARDYKFFDSLIQQNI